eukprot:scaffold11077_cov78-Cyclotella_meneghiniana.AAC.7
MAWLAKKRSSTEQSSKVRTGLKPMCNMQACFDSRAARFLQSSGAIEYVMSKGSGQSLSADALAGQ